MGVHLFFLLLTIVIWLIATYLYIYIYASFTTNFLINTILRRVNFAMVYHNNVSRTLRIVQIACAVIWCLLVAGPSFGFAALKPILVSEGVYKTYCTPKEIKEGVEICQEQDLKLNMIFTVAAVITNASGIIVGPILDKYGPKVCGTLGATLIIIACIILRSALSIQAFDGFIIGYSFLALGGPFTFISSFQLSNTFPQSSGLILAILSGSFDASSAVFLGYRILYEKSNGNFHLHDFFTLFLAAPIFILLCQMFIMPHDSYVTMKELALDSLDIHEASSECSSITPSEQTQLLAGPSQHKYVDNVDPESQSTSKHNHANEIAETSGVWGVLHGFSAMEQIKTPWFSLMVLFTTIHMIRINYFVATVLSQYIYLLGSVEKAEQLTKYFDVVLPLGGIVSMPFVGLLLDYVSTFNILSILMAMSIIMGVCGGIRNSLLAGYTKVSIIVVFRPFFYTVISDYAAKVFGFDTFGRVYGLIMSISGVFNLVQAFLDSTTHVYFKGNPIPVNMLLVAVSIVIGLGFLGYIRSQVRHIKRRQLELEARRAPVLPMP